MKWMMVCLLIAAVVATFFFLWKRAQPKPVEYETLTVKRRNIEKRTVVTGKVEPRDEVAIKAQISGIIDRWDRSAAGPTLPAKGLCLERYEL